MHRKQVKHQLSDRFQKAIDKAAMISNVSESDNYLAEWRRGLNTECGNNLELELEKFSHKIESEYTNEFLNTLVRSGGFNHENKQEKPS